MPSEPTVDDILKEIEGRMHTCYSGMKRTRRNDEILAAHIRELQRAVEALETIDTMPVDGCSPLIVESMLRQAKTLAYNALNPKCQSCEGTGLVAKNTGCQKCDGTGVQQC